MNEQMYILGIESSCDDTSASVIHGRKVLSNITANQKIHEQFGGVVPELASRAHQQNIIPVVKAALDEAAITPDKLGAIAYTRGPGLLGSLLVGSAFAKSMAQALNIPLYDVHHMKAHVLAHLIENPEQENPPFPFLCLTVSGGHTQIVEVKSPHNFHILGETMDDAAGEAFDKAAKMMGLSYPGGPVIDELATSGNPNAFTFGKPMLEGLKFSFSGLKTSLLYFLQKERKKNPRFIDEHKADVAASFQKAIVDVLLEKFVLAAKQTGIMHLALAGGVSANSELRKRLRDVGEKNGWKTYIPPFSYCTDNGAMIAIAGHFMHEVGLNSSLSASSKARWSMEDEG